jgi:hypothetical protein
MKRLAEYLERVHVFERMAARETDPKLKVQLAKQAASYRKLAAERAARLQLSRPPQSASDTRKNSTPRI